MSNPKDKSLDLVEFRERLDGSGSERFWKSLEELAEDDGFSEMMDREFPSFNAELESQVDRRGFMKLMGASLALGGLTACDMPPAEKIVPYVNAPEYLVPGNPLFYATTLSWGREAVGVLVETHEGRPTKIEGNPDHPASLGATDAICQGMVLGLYDPDRSTTILNEGRISTWTNFVNFLTQALGQRSTGRGVRILTQTILSPTIGSQLDEFLQAMPEAKWVQYDAGVPSDGRRQRAVYDFENADVIFVLDSDITNGEPGHIRYARQIADRRRARAGNSDIARLYVAETMPTATGSIADHRFPVRQVDLEHVAAMLAGSADPGVSSDVSWVDAVREDLMAHRGRAVVVAGDHLSERTHQLVAELNQQIGAIGSLVRYEDASEVRPTDQFADLVELVREMKAGEVELLIILGGNPVYSAPGSLGFEEALLGMNRGSRIHHSLYYDETSRNCDWHVNAAHVLESWGDARAFDGTYSVSQPMIEPLYAGKSTIDMLNAINGKLSTSALDTVREHWRGRVSVSNFDDWWQTILHNGVIPAGVAPVAYSWSEEAAAVSSVTPPSEVAPGLELVFRPDPAIFDGRFANNGWLMEMPRPITKVTWDNAAYMSYATAKQLGVRNNDVVTLSYEGGQVSAPVWIVFGHAPDSVTVHLGFGRSRAGHVGNDKGFNANVLRTVANPWGGSGLQVEKTAKTYKIACTQKHFSMHERDLIRAVTAGEFARMGYEDDHQASPAIEGAHGTAANELTDEGSHEVMDNEHAGGHGGMPEPDIYPDWAYPGYAWGMAIDTSVCTGCSACIVACVAENNIPVVGKREVLREREMHWLRVDRYYRGDREAPQTFHQPIPCQQCEKAPCEPVCPVGATSHSHEGLNDMTYNRCVGTRYCSNNCPYKVRRFNFFQYADFETESLKLGRNPNVTVRSRGVMEKCTYCTQRISAARIVAEREGRVIRDGELRTACQQGCPTDAISFGNINDPDSRVAKEKAEKHNYVLIEEYNTQPRTSYLSTVRNLNPAIEPRVRETEIES